MLADAYSESSKTNELFFKFYYYVKEWCVYSTSFQNKIKNWDEAIFKIAVLWEVQEKAESEFIKSFFFFFFDFLEIIEKTERSHIKVFEFFLKI